MQCNKPVTEGQILYDSTCVKILNSQVHWAKEWNDGCQKLWGGGNVELLISGPNIHVKEDE